MKNILLLLLAMPLFSVAQNLEVIGNINAKGQIQINGNSGTTGQVLTSNGANPPAWTTLSNSTGGKFLMLTTNQTGQTDDFDITQNAPTSQVITVIYSSVSYNTNSDVSIVPSTGIITCNRTGLYHFEGMLRYFVTSSQTQIARGSIGYQINGGSTILLDEVLLTQTIPVSVNNAYNISIPFTVTRYLTAGQNIRFVARIHNLDTNPAIIAMGLSSGSSVSGYFVTD
jgi:hypothetical protein